MWRERKRREINREAGPCHQEILSLEPKYFVIIGAKVQNFRKTSQFKLPSMRKGPTIFPRDVDICHTIPSTGPCYVRVTFLAGDPLPDTTDRLTRGACQLGKG